MANVMMECSNVDKDVFLTTTAMSMVIETVRANALAERVLAMGSVVLVTIFVVIVAGIASLVFIHKHSSTFSRPNRFKTSYRTCNGKCIYKTEQCAGKCPDGSEKCGSRCLAPNSWDIDNYRSCGDKCIYKYYQCNGDCPDGYTACGSYRCIRDSDYQHYFTCGSSCMYKTTWTNYYFRSCGDRCLYRSDYLPIYSLLNQIHFFRSNFNLFYACEAEGNAECIRTSQPCKGKCPVGESVL